MQTTTTTKGSAALRSRPPFLAGEEAEKMHVSTQTSRSVVVVARARAKNKQNEVRYTSLANGRAADRAAAILGNVTRATPTGIRDERERGGIK